jgi:hypothetical protein
MVLDYDSPVGFVIVCHSGKSFVALAESARAKQEWLDAFSECFAALKSSEVRPYSYTSYHCFYHHCYCVSVLVLTAIAVSLSLSAV